MSTKDNVLHLLKENSDRYYSGEQIAKKLNISRNSVWKAINSLKNSGYNILASSNKGYKLEADDILHADSIVYYLNDKDFFDITVHDRVTSTNTLAKQLASTELKEGNVIVAKQQTHGKGRMQRAFYSPDNSGVYFTLTLCPNMEGKMLPYFTALAATSICNAVASLCNKNPKIKWVNDIFIDQKKISGILCEASFSVENASLEYIIIGIGINVYKPKDGFPKELDGIVGYVSDNQIPDLKNQLVANILNNILLQYQKFDTKEITREYKSLSFIISKEVYIVKDKEYIPVVVVDINDKNELVVRHRDGAIEHIVAGEVSLRMENCDEK